MGTVPIYIDAEYLLSIATSAPTNNAQRPQERYATLAALDLAPDEDPLWNKLSSSSIPSF